MKKEVVRNIAFITLLAVLICLMVQLTLKIRYETKEENRIFTTVQDVSGGTIVRHKETNVLYFCEYGGMTVLLNADGTPMVWDGEEGVEE